jgi:methylated-DNA-protein-cysteine methyltransferase-like protein
VFDVVRLIPKGRVTNYGSIAKYLGSGKSSRMVGWAMNASHGLVPSIPAQRVVNRNGLLTGKSHFETPTKMQELLEEEGVRGTGVLFLIFVKSIIGLFLELVATSFMPSGVPALRTRAVIEDISLYSGTTFVTLPSSFLNATASLFCLISKTLGNPSMEVLLIDDFGKTSSRIRTVCTERFESFSSCSILGLYLVQCPHQSA